MYSRLFTTLSAVLLCSCVTMQKTSVPVNTRPVSLSSAQVAVIKRDLIKSLKGAVSGTFGSMSASSDDTSIYVCGWVNGNISSINTTGASPYFGTLTEAQGKPILFSPIILGINSNNQTEITDMCSKYQIHVEFPLE